MRNSTLLPVLFALLAASALADKDGSQPPLTICPECSCQPCAYPQNGTAPAGAASLDFAQGNLSITPNFSGASKSILHFAARDDSYNADASHAQLDTIMSFGWN